MTNYYELLEVAPTALETEIDAACSAVYNKWRRLVTHHDQAIRGKAEQALQQIEAIRSTLTDPAKRAAYDAGIGLGAHVGGLADPEAVLRAQPLAPAAAPIVPALTPPAPPRAAPAVAPAVAPAAPGLWACPKKGCGADNPPNTKYCFKCGTQLVRECPECGKMSSLVATGFCGECGFRYDVAADRAQTKAKGIEEQQALKEQQNRIEGLRTEREQVKTGAFTFWLVVDAVVFVLLLLGQQVGASLVFVVIGALIWLGLHSKQQQQHKLDEAIASRQHEVEKAQQTIRTLQAHYDQLGMQKAG